MCVCFGGGEKGSEFLLNTGENYCTKVTDQCQRPLPRPEFKCPLYK